MLSFLISEKSGSRQVQLRDPFLGTVLVPPDNRVPLLNPKEETIYLLNIVWKAANVTQMSRSGMFKGEHVVQEMWRQEKKICIKVAGVCTSIKSGLS